jgi:hypothetical protein
MSISGPSVLKVRRKEEPLQFEQADADVIIRMLYFCSDGPRAVPQIMTYCKIDGIQFNKFCDHCIKRGLVKVAPFQDSVLSIVATEHGKEVLAKAQTSWRRSASSSSSENEIALMTVTYILSARTV